MSSCEPGASTHSSICFSQKVAKEIEQCDRISIGKRNDQTTDRFVHPLGIHLIESAPVH